MVGKKQKEKLLFVNQSVHRFEDAASADWAVGFLHEIEGDVENSAEEEKHQPVKLFDRRNITLAGYTPLHLFHLLSSVEMLLEIRR